MHVLVFCNALSVLQTSKHAHTHTHAYKYMHTAHTCTHTHIHLQAVENDEYNLKDESGRVGTDGKQTDDPSEAHQRKKDHESLHQLAAGFNHQSNRWNLKWQTGAQNTLQKWHTQSGSLVTSHCWKKH